MICAQYFYACYFDRNSLKRWKRKYRNSHICWKQHLWHCRVYARSRWQKLNLIWTWFLGGREKNHLESVRNVKVSNCIYERSFYFASIVKWSIVETCVYMYVQTLLDFLGTYKDKPPLPLDPQWLMIFIEISRFFIAERKKLQFFNKEWRNYSQ